MGKDWATDSSELTTRVVSYVSVGLDTLPELEEDGNDDWDNVPTLHSTTVNHTPLLELDNHWLPDSYAEAMTWPDLWQGPIEKELEVMHEQEVWKVIDPPPDACLVKTWWTFANKYDGEGRLNSQKMRLITKGFTQIPGVDFYESYASVVRYESLRMNLAIAAVKDMEAWQIDYVAAYLNAKPQAMVYIKLPDDAKVEGKVGLLQKSLYEMMDGVANWWETLDKNLRALGYKFLRVDPSVHSHHIDGETTITSTYTDNTMGISMMKKGAERVKAELGRKYKTKDLGEASLMLGIKIERDREAGTISILQCAYLKWVLNCFEMSEYNPATTPISLGTVLTKEQSPSTDEDQQFMAGKPYCQVLGSIMYAQIATCPDLSYAVSTLSKFASDPGKPHWTALMWVL